MAHCFHVSSHKAHRGWNNAIPPALTVPSDSEITFDLRDGGNIQVRPDNEANALQTFDSALADPREAARMALRDRIDWLERDKGLSRVDGYMLATVAARLRMTEVVVDVPNFAVSCSIPLSTFDG